MSDDITIYRWTYAHQCFISDGKVGSKWFDHNGEERVFGASPKRGASPGTMWDVETKDNGRAAYIKSATYVGIMPEGVPPEWRLKHRAVDIERQQATELRKLGDIETIDSMTIGEVREALKGNWKHRAAMLALVMSRLGVS